MQYLDHVAFRQENTEVGYALIESRLEAQYMLIKQDKSLLAGSNI